MKKPDFENFIGSERSQSAAESNQGHSFDFNCWYEQPKPVIGYKMFETVILKTPKTISTTIENFTFVFDPSLKEICDEIDESKNILNLEFNWDGCDADVINKKAYLEAINWLSDYANALLRLHKIVIKSPEINPCRDGSVDLSWRTATARLLINFKFRDDVVFVAYYRDNYNNRQASKGNIDLGQIDESFLVWMKNLR